jgi:hypothetical protein
VAPVTPVTPPAPPPEPPKPETPLESLNPLRFDLVAGKREEMPLGVIRRGDSDYMVVPTPMTWADAALFAERFGTADAFFKDHFVLNYCPLVWMRS